MTDRIRRIIIISLLIMLVLALLAGVAQTFRLSAASARVDKLALDLDAEKRRANGLEGQLRQARTSVKAMFSEDSPVIFAAPSKKGDAQANEQANVKTGFEQVQVDGASADKSLNTTPDKS